jgi:hypothetical protein
VGPSEPMTVPGQNTKYSERADVFRCSPNNGVRQEAGKE